MRKPDFIKRVSQNSNMTLKDSQYAVEATFNTLREILLEGEEFAIERLFTFKNVTRAGRTGFSPLTREKIFIKPQRSVRIKLSPIFKKLLNEKLSVEEEPVAEVQEEKKASKKKK